MPQPRRSPAADQRKRDPERTRERILDAALIEFSEHGLAGARTGAIAARAGVNQQLISYYFDGKEGLYRALQRRWERTGGTPRPEVPMAHIVAGFLQTDATQRAWARLLAWEGLTASTTGADRGGAGGAESGGAESGGAESGRTEPGGAEPGGGKTGGRDGGDRVGVGPDDAETRDYFGAMLADIRRRQRAGELAEDLDPALVGVIFFGATLAPAVLPQIVRRLTGLDADSPEFLAKYADELVRVLTKLAGAPRK